MQSKPDGHVRLSGPHHGYGQGPCGHGCECACDCGDGSGQHHRVNAHESEHVSENESEVVLASVPDYVGGNDLGSPDVVILCGQEQYGGSAG